MPSSSLAPATRRDRTVAEAQENFICQWLVKRDFNAVLDFQSSSGKYNYISSRQHDCMSLHMEFNSGYELILDVTQMKINVGFSGI